MNSFLIFGRDNGKYAYSENTAHRCPECRILDREKSLRAPLKGVKYDISSTYDNELVVSDSVFQELSKTIDRSNFEKAGDYYYVLPRATIEFDSVKRLTKFGSTCSTCGNYSHVIGISPAYLKQDVLVSGIYATDLRFGDTEDASANLTPAIIISKDVLDTILALKPSGLDYEPTNC